MNEQFWCNLEQLWQENKLVIDRPKGSHHPRYPEIVYPLDYGYLDGTSTIDGGGIDVWIGSLSEQTISAVVVTVDLSKKDVEIKILIGCSQADMAQILPFHQTGMQAALLLERSDL